MNKYEKFVITINRELGSGGRTIGRKLAERLGQRHPGEPWSEAEARQQFDL